MAADLDDLESLMTGLAQFINDDDDDQREYEAEMMRRSPAKNTHDAYVDSMVREAASGDATDERVNAETPADPAENGLVESFMRYLDQITRELSAPAMIRHATPLHPGHFTDAIRNHDDRVDLQAYYGRQVWVDAVDVAQPGSDRTMASWSRPDPGFDEVDRDLGCAEIAPNSISTRSIRDFQLALERRGVRQVPDAPQDALMGFRVVVSPNMPPNTAALHDGTSIRLITWDAPGAEE